MFRNFVYSLITKGVVALINFSILIISSRYLGVSSRGEISIFILNITIVQILNEVYTGYSIIYFIPRFDLRKIMVYGFIYTLVFCSLSNLLVVFLHKQVPGFEWLGYIISLLVVWNTFNCIILLGRQDLVAYNLLSFIQPVLLLSGILFFVFILRDYTFASYVYPLLFSFLAAILISSFKVIRSLSGEAPKLEFHFAAILTKGFAFQATLFMYIFINRYSYYLLPTNADVGLYASASSLTESLLILGSSMAPVLLSKVANQGGTRNSVRLTLTLSKVSFVFTAAGIILIFCLPDSFFIRLLGTGFSNIKALMMLYAPGVLMVSFFIPIASYYSAIGRQKLVLCCYSLGFFSALILAPVLVHKYKNAGAAYNADIAFTLTALALSFCFLITHKISFKRLVSFHASYINPKQFLKK